MKFQAFGSISVIPNKEFCSDWGKKLCAKFLFPFLFLKYLPPWLKSSTRPCMCLDVHQSLVITELWNFKLIKYPFNLFYPSSLNGKLEIDFKEYFIFWKLREFFDRPLDELINLFCTFSIRFSMEVFNSLIQKHLMHVKPCENMVIKIANKSRFPYLFSIEVFNSLIQKHLMHVKPCENMDIQIANTSVPRYIRSVNQSVILSVCQ